MASLGPEAALEAIPFPVLNACKFLGIGWGMLLF